MLSPSVSITAPPPENPNSTSANPTTPTTRRRGLSYLRNLSQGRSGAVSPGETGRSARSYFQRSISFTDKNNSSTSLPPPRVRLQSPSRPNEPTSPIDEISSVLPPSAPGSPVETSKPPPQEPPAQAEDNTATQSTIPFPQLEGTHPVANGTSDEMARTNSRRNTASSQQAAADNGVTNGDGTSLQPTTTNASATGPTREGQEAEPNKQLPTIRFLAHQEIRNGRQSLNFGPISRTLPNENAIIRVGRYSEREGIPPSNPAGPSDAPVGFKSKVVSRKHCEFTFSEGQWHLKDVSSSSGTFLNHIRLSQPNTESKLFPVKDGDIIQLGIDFRGGEEMIFRCVKIRVECNRSWQKKPNTFNKSRHAQLQSLAKEQAAATGNNSGECSICLGSVMPCQALFVAPCAHAWHYKCIRPLLEGNTSTYPQFQCPNCRAYFDLSADVDVVESDTDDWKDNKGESSAHEEPTEVGMQPVLPPAILELPEQVNGHPTPTAPRQPTPPPATPSAETAALLPSPSLNASGLLARRQANNPSSPEIQSVTGLNMPNRNGETEDRNLDTIMTTRAETPDGEPIMTGEGPLTPMNNIGPFVFDGNAGRDSARRVGNIFEVTEGN